MSRDDVETGTRLLNPYIEIRKGIEQDDIGVNSSTFKPCLEHIIPPFRDNGPTFPESEVGMPFYSIYGVVGRTVVPGGYLNIAEPPISRTLIGFLTDEILKKNLPKVHKLLNLPAD